MPTEMPTEMPENIPFPPSTGDLGSGNNKLTLRQAAAAAPTSTEAQAKTQAQALVPLQSIENIPAPQRAARQPREGEN